MKVIVAEFGSWHDECLYSSCYMFSQLGHEVVLAANSRLRSRVATSLSGVTSEQHYFDFGSSLAGLRELWRFRRFVLASGASMLHINTAQGSLAWKFFLLPLPRRIAISGVLHNVAKLRGSVGQKLITRRIDRYVLLSDLLVDAYRATGCRVPSVVSYAIFQPHSEAVDASVCKPAGERWLVVPGAVNYHRRDYETLLQLSLPEGVRVIILGNINREDGPDFRARLAALPAAAQAHFMLFDSFVPNATFEAYLQQCDYLLPLVHTACNGLGKYLTDKISGTYNLSVIYRRPMLCPLTLQPYGAMADVALFYDREDAASLSALLREGQLDKKEAEADLFRSPKWTFAYQLQQMQAAF